MKHFPLFEEFLNEQQKYSSNTWPVKTEKDAVRLLSGKSRGSWRARKSADDLIDVLGKEVSILENDEITEYLQIWSEDDSYIYKITRRNRANTWHLYIPSKFQSIDQYDKIDSTR